MGWFLGERATGNKKAHAENSDQTLEFNQLGQFFGYLCAVSYIASRLPQLILNWRRKTTDGLSMLFFLFACLGNVTYVLSIVVYEPKCRHDTCEPGEASRIYSRYILVNLSWLAGSAITLFMDLGVFIQYFIYKTEGEQDGQEDEFIEEEDRDGWNSNWDQRPLLERSDSGR